MRQYETDSAQAAARVLALALLADGGLDQAELRSLARTNLVRQLGMSDEAFETVLRNYCHDVLQGTNYIDGMHLRLSSEIMQSLLDDIRDPGLQWMLMGAMREIADANDVISVGEAALLAAAAERWGRPYQGDDESFH